MTINGYNDLVGNLATANADKDLLVKKNGNYKKGMKICRETGCTRVVDGKCLGWKDPLYMWEKYGECPHFSDDPKLVSKIEDACKAYQDYMDGRGDLVGEKAEVSH